MLMFAERILESSWAVSILQLAQWGRGGGSHLGSSLPTLSVMRLHCAGHAKNKQINAKGMRRPALICE
jgi:hypothetical protein